MLSFRYPLAFRLNTNIGPGSKQVPTNVDLEPLLFSQHIQTTTCSWLHVCADTSFISVGPQPISLFLCLSSTASRSVFLGKKLGRARRDDQWFYDATTLKVCTALLAAVLGEKPNRTSRCYQASHYAKTTKQSSVQTRLTLPQEETLKDEALQPVFPQC